MENLPSRDPVAAVAATASRLRQELSRTIVGQTEVIEQITACIFAGGHALLTGVPGLGKTLLVKSIAQLFSLQFKRIQFTPDLMPSDIFGTEVMEENQHTREHSFRFIPGPVFTNILLADEINRTPPKTQSALLEAMQERQVTVGRVRHKLTDPFFVLATQNPIEQEGTYPLPEAQVDRFMLKCIVTHPSRDDERRIMARFTRKDAPAVKGVVAPEQVAALRSALELVYCDDNVGNYILDLVFATRDPATIKLPDLKAHIALGASPRASLCLNLAARANALLHGRAYATPQDVKEIAHDVLRHRILVTYEAEAEGVTSDTIIARLLREVPVP